MANGGFGQGFGQAWGRSMEMDRKREEDERKKDRRNMMLMQLVGAPIAQGITESVKTAVAPAFEESVSKYFRGEEGSTLATQAISAQNRVKDLETVHKAFIEAGDGELKRGILKRYEEDFKNTQLSKYRDKKIGSAVPNTYLIDQLWNAQQEKYSTIADTQAKEITEALALGRSAPDLKTLTARLKSSKYLANENLLVRPFRWIANKIKRTDPELERRQAYDYVIHGKNVIRGKDGEIDTTTSQLGKWANSKEFNALVEKAINVQDPQAFKRFREEMVNTKEYKFLDARVQEVLSDLTESTELMTLLKGGEGKDKELTEFQRDLLDGMTKQKIRHTRVNYEKELAKRIKIPEEKDISKRVEEWGLRTENTKYVNSVRQAVINDAAFDDIYQTKGKSYIKLSPGDRKAVDDKVNQVLGTYMRLSSQAIQGAKLRAFEDGEFTPDQFKNSGKYSTYVFDSTLNELINSHALHDVTVEDSPSSIFSDLNIFGNDLSEITKNYRVSDSRGLEDYVYNLLTGKVESTVNSEDVRKYTDTRKQEEAEQLEREYEGMSPEDREQAELKKDFVGSEQVRIGIDNVLSVDFRSLNPKNENDVNNYILPIKRILTYSELPDTQKRKFVEALQYKIYAENFEGKSATQIGTDKLAYIKNIEFRNLTEAENIFSPIELETLRRMYPQDPYKQGTPGDIKEYFGLPREPKNKIGVEENRENQRPASVPPQVYTEEELQKQLEEDPFYLMAPKRTSFQSNTPDVETGVGNVLDDDYKMDEVNFSSPEELELRFGKVGEDISPYVIKGKRREATALFKQIQARKNNMPVEEVVDKVADVVLTDKEKADAIAPVTRPSLLSENQALTELDVTDKLTNVLTEKGLDMEAILIPFKAEDELRFGKVGRDINTQSILATEETEEEIILAPPNKRTEIDSAIDSVQSVFNDPAHIQTFMKRIAAVESAKGENSKTYQIRNDGFGPYQMTKTTFEGLLNRLNGRGGFGKTRVQKWIEPIKKEFDIDVTQLEFEEMTDPLVSTLMARLHLLSKTPAIPKDLSGQADYWKTKWNSESPLAKGTRRQFVREANYYERAKN
jgi:uncharacterized ubiquitin-like protein YukD